MKKALTIYIPDDAKLTNFCGAFICFRDDGQNALTMLNEEVPDGATGFFLPWKSETNKTEWILDTKLPEIIEADFDDWDKEKAITLGKNIKAAIKTNEMTQREFAKKMNLTEVSISRYINGARTPSAPTMCKMAKVLGVSMESLMKGGVMDNEEG